MPSPARQGAINGAYRTLVARFLVFLALTVALLVAMAAIASARPAHDANGNSAQVIGGRPSGCPHAYCGCGLARYLGLTDRALNLAWEWARRFPHTFAHAGAVAVRHHHVMLLEAHVEGSRWLVRDFNGGRHLSWLHVRSVNGFIFVSPNRRQASADN